MMNVHSLKNQLKGHVLLPEDPDYDEVRKIWNAMIDRHPALICRCVEAADVAHSIAYARANGLEISIRGAGHNIAGNAVCDNGLTIDLSMMKNVRVEAEKKRAYVEAGATLHDFDSAVQAHGLATPVGINSTTGIAGLTLGGGFGWLTRRYGMSVDNLISADVILADGSRKKASETENTDLFWAIRGGGGNFGVVTQFEFKLHPVGPEIFGGLLVFSMQEARQVLDHYRKFVLSAPEDLNVWVIMRKAPPLPFLTEDVHGKDVVVLAAFYSGDVATGEKRISPLRNFGKVLGVHTGQMPYVRWQQAFDPLLTTGARNYWKSHNFIEINDNVIDTMIEYASQLPSPQCEIFLALLSGAANRVAPDAMAYGNRDTKFVLNVHGRWGNVADDKSCIRWAREFFEAAAPYASKGAYINFMTEEERDRVASAYGANYDRLVQIKMKYDPENVFHLNQNIKPR